MADCLTEEQLDLLASEGLPETEAEPLAAHLAGCPPCRKRLNEFRANLLCLADAKPALVDGTQTIGQGSGPSPAMLSPPAEHPVDRSGSVLPHRIPGYKILRELHRGGQGIVFQAVQTSTKRKVAIKVLLEGAYASPSARRRFEREVDLVARLNHRNIITIFDSGVTPDGRNYCVMDYIRGLRLNEYIKEKKLPLDETLKLFSSVCDAVSYAHQKGIIHRDLKPSNILVDSDGTAKVLDFGLAKPLSESAESLVSLTGQVVGTLPYISPEQAQGNPDRIDVRTDVYSLGVILYELLTGSFPYPVVGHMMDVLKHIAETAPTPPSDSWKADSGVSRRKGRHAGRRARCPLDNDVETIVLKSLSKEPERRYQSVGELARDIGNYVGGEPIEAKRDSFFYVLRKKAALHSYATAVLALLVLSMVGFAGISFDFWMRERAAAADLERINQDVLARNKELEQVAASAKRSVRGYVLGWFLLEWREGRFDRAKEIRDQMSTGSAEFAAMEFLLDESYTVEKLRARLGEANEPLVYFVAGERALRAGRREEAIQAFHRCVASAKAGWLAASVRARLAQLRPNGTRGALEATQ